MCDLVKFVDDLKVAILNFRLDLCCFVFSVRAGTLLCGYFNVISSMICLTAVSAEVLPPLLMNTQQSFMEGDYIKSTCAFAYGSDICLAVLLLCAMYRKDTVLLRYYTYCGLAMFASTVLVYSMVIGVLSALHTFLLVVSLTYQAYLILLVRSVMVELKHESEKLKNYYPNYPIYWRHNDIEAADRSPIQAYEMHELNSNKNTPTNIPATVNLPKRRASEPVNSKVPTSKSVKVTVESKTTKPVQGTNQPTLSKPVEDTTEPVNEPTTSKPVKDTTKPKTTEPVNQPTTSKPVKEHTETKISKSTVPIKGTIQPTTSTAVKDTTEPETSETVRDIIQPTTSGTEKVFTKPESFEKPKALRYPYKFIAIKIPKEETIKEEKENEDKGKETDKDVTNEEAKNVTEEKKEVAKEVKKRKRSIFGRKIKSKSENDTTKDEDEKN